MTGRRDMLTRREVEFTYYSDFSIKSIDGKVSGLSERIISGKPDSDNLVRMLEFAPGTDTNVNGVQVHDYWEEIFILEGSVYDLTLQQEFVAGMVATRPPGMKHGPWKTEKGCIMYEVRHPKQNEEGLLNE